MQPSIIKSIPSNEYLTSEQCYILELLNKPQDDSLSIALARVEPGVTTAWHSLDGVTERYLIIEGSGKVEIGELEPADVGINDVVIIPPGVRQRISNIGKGDLLFYCICTPGFTQESYRELE